MNQTIDKPKTIVLSPLPNRASAESVLSPGQFPLQSENKKAAAAFTKIFTKRSLHLLLMLAALFFIVVPGFLSNDVILQEGSKAMVLVLLLLQLKFLTKPAKQ